MARDHSGGPSMTDAEAAARERAGRKRLAEDGCPQDRQADRTPRGQGRDRPTGTASEDRETGAVDPPDGR